MSSSSKQGPAEQLVMFQDLFKDEKTFEKGYAQAKIELKDKFVLVAKMGERLVEERRQFVERVKPELIAFCLQVTEQLLRQELTSPATFMKLLSSLLSAVGRDQPSVSVILAPEDLEMMASEITQLESEKSRWRHVYFLSDPTVQRGDVRIESETLFVNCAIARELESIRAHILRG